MNIPIVSLSNLKARFVGLTAREQAAILLLIAMAFFWAGDRFLLKDQRREMQKLEAEILRIATELQITKRTRESVERGDFDRASDDRLIRERNELKKQVDVIDTVLASIQGKTPQIGEIIRGLVRSQHPGVKILSVKTQATKPIQLGQGAQPIYRHGVELEISGRYLDLLAYLTALEARATGILWSDLKLSSAQYPESIIRVTIYVLSNQADPIIS
jgi:MSHA biogenesis protein MshJ